MKRRVHKCGVFEQLVYINSSSQVAVILLVAHVKYRDGIVIKNVQVMWRWREANTQ